MKRVFWVVPAVLFFLAVAFLDGTFAAQKQPMIKKGVLDLGGWNFDHDGPIRLDGEWEVVWESLDTPGKGDGLKSASPAYTTIPAPWSKSKPEADFLDATGAATLRLVIKNCPTAEQLALRLTNVYNSWALWENGSKVGQSGKPALKVDDEIPRMSSMVVPLQTGRNTSDGLSTLELVLQVSNHHYREGGVISSIRLGPAYVMQEQQNSGVGVAMFFAGCLFIMVIYHVVLYLFRRRSSWPCSAYSGLSVTAARTPATGSFLRFFQMFRLSGWSIWDSSVFSFLSPSDAPFFVRSTRRSVRSGWKGFSGCSAERSRFWTL